MYTRQTLPTDGSNGPFPIGINYLQGNTILVEKLDSLVSTPVAVSFAFTGSKTEAKPSGSSITLTEAIPAGKFIRISKVVDMDTPVVQWGVGTELTQKNLQRTSVNMMEMAQTAYDKATESADKVEAVDSILADIALLVPETLLATAAEVADDAAEADVARTEAQDAQAATEAVYAALVARLQSTFTLDFGDSSLEAVFTHTVAGLQVGTIVRVDQVAIPAAGRDQDECEMDTIVCTAYVSATNTLTIYAKSVTGPVHGQYTFALTY